MDFVKQHQITEICNGESGESIFKENIIPLAEYGGMHISDQQSSINFRHRRSVAGYCSDWHVAGDPTLIIISQGTLRLTLRSGQSREFSAGEQFIAADFTATGSEFNKQTDGHKAEVVGDQNLIALHIKLAKRC